MCGQGDASGLLILPLTATTAVLMVVGTVVRTFQRLIRSHTVAVRRVWPTAGHALSRATTVTLSVPEALTVLALQWALGELVRFYRGTKTA